MKLSDVIALLEPKQYVDIEQELKDGSGKHSCVSAVDNVCFAKDAENSVSDRVFNTEIKRVSYNNTGFGTVMKITLVSDWL